MEKQIIEKHDELLITYKSTISKKQFPEYSIQENPTINYPEYINVSFTHDLDNITLKEHITSKEILSLFQGVTTNE